MILPQQVVLREVRLISKSPVDVDRRLKIRVRRFQNPSSGFHTGFLRGSSEIASAAGKPPVECGASCNEVSESWEVVATIW